MSNAKPPPYSPSSGADPFAAEDARRYAAYLAAADRPADDQHEDRSLRVGGWRFYFRGHGGPREDTAGIDEQGHVVTGFHPADWYEFLSTPELDGEGALRRVTWLLGRPGPVDTSYRFDDPDVAAWVRDPFVDRDGDRVTFEGWVLYPPEMQSPHRLRISAAPEVPTGIESALWSEVTQP